MRHALGSYQISREEALRNACRMMKETGVDALKLEGGIEIIDTVKSLIDAGIPVHGHLGLTPQSVNKFGGYGIRAKEEAEAEKLISDAIALDKAGCLPSFGESASQIGCRGDTPGKGCNYRYRCRRWLRRTGIGLCRRLRND